MLEQTESATNTYLQVGDNTAPIIFKLENTTLDAMNGYVEARGWSTEDLLSFASYVCSMYSPPNITITNELFNTWKNQRATSGTIPVSVSTDDDAIQFFATARD